MSAEPPLWAPWRMEYILRPKAGNTCVFCEHAAAPPGRHRESLVLVSQRHAFVCLNRFPFAASHLLVIPRRHVADLADLSDEEYAALATLLRESTKALRAATRCEAMNVGMNLGRAAGAGIADHLHWHLVPRWSGDTNFMPVIAGTHVMPEHLDDSWRRLLPHFARIEGEHAPEPRP